MSPKVDRKDIIMLKLGKILISAMLAAICFCTLSVSVFANDGKTVDETGYDDENTAYKSKINNKLLIYKTMNEEEFWQVVSIFIEDNECHNCTKSDLEKSYLTDIFQIPQLTRNHQIQFDDSIWHSFLKNDNEILAVIDFVVVNSNVFYSIS